MFNLRLALCCVACGVFAGYKEDWQALVCKYGGDARPGRVVMDRTERSASLTPEDADQEVYDAIERLSKDGCRDEKLAADIGLLPRRSKPKDIQEAAVRWIQTSLAMAQGYTDWAQAIGMWGGECSNRTVLFPGLFRILADACGLHDHFSCMISPPEEDKCYQTLIHNLGDGCENDQNPQVCGRVEGGVRDECVERIVSIFDGTDVLKGELKYGFQCQWGETRLSVLAGVVCTAEDRAKCEEAGYNSKDARVVVARALLDWCVPPDAHDRNYITSMARMYEVLDRIEIGILSMLSEAEKYATDLLLSRGHKDARVSIPEELRATWLGGLSAPCHRYCNPPMYAHLGQRLNAQYAVPIVREWRRFCPARKIQGAWRRHKLRGGGSGLVLPGVEERVVLPMAPGSERVIAPNPPTVDVDNRLPHLLVGNTAFKASRASPPTNGGFVPPVGPEGEGGLPPVGSWGDGGPPCLALPVVEYAEALCQALAVAVDVFGRAGYRVVRRAPVRDLAQMFVVGMLYARSRVAHYIDRVWVSSGRALACVTSLIDLLAKWVATGRMYVTLANPPRNNRNTGYHAVKGGVRLSGRQHDAGVNALVLRELDWSSVALGGLSSVALGRVWLSGLHYAQSINRVSGLFPGNTTVHMGGVRPSRQQQGVVRDLTYMTRHCSAVALPHTQSGGYVNSVRVVQQDAYPKSMLRKQYTPSERSVGLLQYMLLMICEVLWLLCCVLNLLSWGISK